MPAKPKAFPDEVNNGMDLRDYLAAKAMQAYLTRESTGELMAEDAAYDMRAVANDSYRMADAMLKAREGGAK